MDEKRGEQLGFITRQLLNAKVSDLSHVDRVSTRDKTNGLEVGFCKVLGKGGCLGIVIHVCQEIAGLWQSREGIGQHTVRGMKWVFCVQGGGGGNKE